MKKQSLLIIGAGASGLMAAKKLSLFFDITILEASDRIGGRINSVSIQNDVIETGAEFIHGNLPVTINLLKEAGIPYVATEGKMYRKTIKGFVEENEMFEGWDELLEKLKTVKKDITLEQFLQKHYSADDKQSVKKQVIAYAEGFDLADISTVSARALYKEWSAGDEDNYRIPTGYTAMLQYMQKELLNDGCQVLFNQHIKLVEWKQNEVIVSTANNEIFKSNKLLITIPPHLFMEQNGKNHLQFNPIINAYTKAAENIGMGSVIKAVIKFKESFWQKDAQFFFSDEKFFPTWWTQLPNTANILTGWMGGPQAVPVSTEKNEGIFQKALHSLSSIFDKPIGELEKLVEYKQVFCWPVTETSAGAYSFDTINSAAAREVLTTPLFKTIFFAGEALYKGNHPGTVEAALVSGQQAAELIQDSV